MSQAVAARGENGREGCEISSLVEHRYRIATLAVFIIVGISSHSSSPNLIKLGIFSCPYWYTENIHFSLMKPNQNSKASTWTQKNQTGPIKSMTHNHCHQSCKGESRTQHHSHTKLGTLHSTIKALLSTRQSLAFYSNRVIAPHQVQSHFFWAGTLIMFFQMKFKFSKKFQNSLKFYTKFMYFSNWIVMLFQ